MSKIHLKEHRKHPRKMLSLPVLVEVKGAQEALLYETLNLSEGGVFIPTDSPLPVMSEVTLSFLIDSANTEIQACGSVVRNVLDQERTDEPVGMAIEFTEFGQLGWGFLKRILESEESASAP